MLVNYVYQSQTLHKTEGWMPVCLPSFDKNSFVHMYFPPFRSEFLVTPILWPRTSISFWLHLCTLQNSSNACLSWKIWYLRYFPQSPSFLNPLELWAVQGHSCHRGIQLRRFLRAQYPPPLIPPSHREFESSIVATLHLRREQQIHDHAPDRGTIQGQEVPIEVCYPSFPPSLVSGDSIKIPTAQCSPRMYALLSRPPKPRYRSTTATTSTTPSTLRSDLPTRLSYPFFL